MMSVLERRKGTLLSWSLNRFEEKEAVITRLISPHEARTCTQKGSKEYIWVTPLDRTILTEEIYRENFNKLKVDGKEYHKYKRSCGHRAYEAATGFGHYPPFWSAQRASKNILIGEEDEDNPSQPIRGIIAPNRTDLIEEIKEALLPIPLGKPAHELGKIYLDGLGGAPNPAAPPSSTTSADKSDSSGKRLRP